MPPRNSRFGKLLAGLLAVSMVLIQLPSAAAAQTKEDKPKAKDKIAVWDFTLEGLQRSEGRAITNRLRSEMVNSEKFQVMSRDQIETLLGEQALGQTLIDAKEAIKAGKLKGVQFVITGTVIAVRGAFQITAEMIDGRTAQIVKSITPGTYRGDFLDFLDVEVPRIAGQLAGIQGFEPVASKKPREKPKPKPDQVAAGGGMSGKALAGWVLLVYAGVAQIVALSIASTAGTDADEATTDEEYQQALDDRDTAQFGQGTAIVAGIVGAILLIVDATQADSTAAGYGPGAAPAGFNVQVRPGSLMAGYALRW